RARADAGGRVQGGSFGALSAAADAGLVEGPYSARVSAGHDRSDGHRTGTDHETTQARITADAPLAGGALRLDAGHARRDFGANAFYAPFDSYEETRTTTSSLSWKSSGMTTTVEPRVSYRRHEDDFILRRDDPSFYRNVHTTQQWSGELVTRWVPRSDMRIALGGEAVRSSIESSSLGERSEDRGALFAEFAAGTAEASLFTAGLRLDRHERFGTHLSPSLAAGYAIAPSFRLRASAGTGFRAPTWTERYYTDPANIGDPDVAPEQFWTVELGTEVRRGSAVLEVAAFLREADDLIDWGRPEGAAPTAPWRTMNVEHATFRGVEGGLRTAAGPVAINARASLLSVDADETAGLASKYALRPLTRTASLEVSAPLGPVRLAVRGAHFRRESGGEWGLLDARVSGRAGAFELFADATNLLDAEYRDVTEQVAPGRAFSLGLRVRR
ncbi:MAG TPA: TonB-dependent receptor, partial [Longimicrobiales bacterium]|nr:TonB-dependent receptor [Longimicrobiales bacterium]